MTDQTNVIPFKKPQEDPKCSFCGEPKSKCKSMVAAPSDKHRICDKCIERCTERLFEEAT